VDSRDTETPLAQRGMLKGSAIDACGVSSNKTGGDAVLFPVRSRLCRFRSSRETIARAVGERRARDGEGAAGEAGERVVDVGR